MQNETSAGVFEATPVDLKWLHRGRRIAIISPSTRTSESFTLSERTNASDGAFLPISALCHGSAREFKFEVREPRMAAKSSNKDDG